MNTLSLRIVRAQKNLKCVWLSCSVNLKQFYVVFNNSPKSDITNAFKLTLYTICTVLLFSCLAEGVFVWLSTYKLWNAF